MALFSPIEGRERDRLEADVRLRDEENDPVESPPEVGPVARIHRLALTDWELLGRAEQQLLARLLIFIEIGKGATAETAMLAAARRSSELAPDLAGRLREAGAEQYRHFRLLQALDRRLDIDAEETIRTEAANLHRYLFDSASPDDPPSDHRSDIAAVVALGSVIVDVLVDTTFCGVDEILERNDALPDLRSVAGEIHAEDREARSRRQAALTQFRDSDPATCESIDATLDRAVLPSLKIIRTVQQQFDVLQMGLVPDEFVARALDRFFDLSGPDVPTAAR